MLPIVETWYAMIGLSVIPKKTRITVFERHYNSNKIQKKRKIALQQRKQLPMSYTRLWALLKITSREEVKVAEKVEETSEKRGK